MSVDILAIGLMVLVTYGTRVGGVLSMASLTWTPRMKAFLTHLGSSVIVAVLVVAIANGTPRDALAALAAAGIMALTGRALPAMIAGVGAAALAAQSTVLH